MFDSLQMLKKLVGEEAEEDVLSFHLESVKEVVKNYCHIQTIPEGLSSIIVRMAADVYRNETLSAAEEEGVVSSIKMGDTTTSFSAARSQEREAFQNSLLKNYRSQLNAYRKVRWK